MGRTARKRRRKRRRPQHGASSVGPADGGSEEAGAPEKAKAASPAKAQPTRSGARARGGRDLPDPPWGSFPLSELVTLAAIVFIVAGFVVAPPRGPVMLGVGLVLGSLAGLEISVREHMAGHRSHTLLIAGAAGVAVMAGAFALDPDGLHPLIKVAAGLLVFGAAALLLARTFRRRSGGDLFRVRG